MGVGKQDVKISYTADNSQESHKTSASLSTNPSIKFHMGVFGEPEVAFLCLAGVDVALTERTDATLPEWVSVDGRIRAV